MKTKRTLIAVAFVLKAMCAGTIGQETSNPKFENAPGWVWHVKPEAAGWESTVRGGLVMRLDQLKDDKLLLSLAYSVEATRDVVRLRPLVVDASGQRFEFAFSSASSDHKVVLTAYLLDHKALAGEQMKFFGVEKLTKDNLQEVVAPAALRALRAAGVQALPFPVIGERYEFELKTIDGRNITSENLRGKVLLLDFWARWCAPCMAKMPKLKETYQRLHPGGFEIVGLNHDYTLEQAKRVIADQKLPWPNVLAPVDKRHRDLWLEATGTTSLPRLLILDRNGILRADVSPDNLDAEIEKLMTSL